MNEAQERAQVVQEALSWLGTPYAHRGRIKGAGVDCGQFVALVFEAAGLVGHIEPDAYPHDWHMHRGEERYLGTVEAYAHQIQGDPQPGDIVLYRYGRCISHGAIVVQWPQIIHSWVEAGVVLDDALANQDMAARFTGAWSLWPRGGE